MVSRDDQPKSWPGLTCSSIYSPWQDYNSQWHSNAVWVMSLKSVTAQSGTKCSSCTFSCVCGRLSRQQSSLPLSFSIALPERVSVVFSCFQFAELIFPWCFQLMWVRTDLWRSTTRRNLKAGIQGTFEPSTVRGEREQVQISQYLVMPAAKDRQPGKVMTLAYLHLCLQEQNYWPRNPLFFFQLTRFSEFDSSGFKEVSQCSASLRHDSI